MLPLRILLIALSSTKASDYCRFYPSAYATAKTVGLIPLLNEGGDREAIVEGLSKVPTLQMK